MAYCITTMGMVLTTIVIPTHASMKYFRKIVKQFKEIV
jgi:hypothetical protein